MSLSGEAHCFGSTAVQSDRQVSPNIFKVTPILRQQTSQHDRFLWYKKRRLLDVLLERCSENLDPEVTVPLYPSLGLSLTQLLYIRVQRTIRDGNSPKIQWWILSENQRKIYQSLNQSLFGTDFT